MCVVFKGDIVSLVSLYSLMMMSRRATTTKATIIFICEHTARGVRTRDNKGTERDRQRQTSPTLVSLHHILLCSCLARLLKADALSERLSGNRWERGETGGRRGVNLTVNTNLAVVPPVRFGGDSELPPPAQTQRSGQLWPGCR